jgi:hypothetical protein
LPTVVDREDKIPVDRVGPWAMAGLVALTHVDTPLEIDY